MEEKNTALAIKLKCASKGLILGSKISKNIRCSHTRASRSHNRDRVERPLSVSKRESSDVASNHLPPNSETEITDTRKLLLMMT